MPGEDGRCTWRKAGGVPGGRREVYLQEAGMFPKDISIKNI